MPAERYYFEGGLLPTNSITLKGDEFHHLIKVMRTRVGEGVEVINGKGVLAKGVLKNVEKQVATLEILEATDKNKPELSIVLAQAIPKLSRLEFILEKGTELGMDEIWLFPSAGSPKSEFSPNQLQRMHHILVAAMKQCGRLFLPKIRFQPELNHWKQECFRGFQFFGDLNENALPFWKILMNEFFETGNFKEKKQYTQKKEIGIFIGPESGFIDDEIDLLRHQGVLGVNLHDNILRTDTAALTALAIASTILQAN